MLYILDGNKIIGSYEDDKYEKVKNMNVFWLQVEVPIIIPGENDIPTSNTYTLTYAEKLDSLRFKRGYLLQQTDCGMVTDCPLSEEQKSELHDYRQSLRDFSKDVTEENIDTYKLPDAPEWAITWFKL